jgi:LmbE family N-acetylglucosaminyl deacetylase
MKKLSSPLLEHAPSRILVVAPHADDETLGAGGTIGRFAANGHHVTVAVMTGHGEGEHPLWSADVWDTVRGEAREAHAALGVKEVIYREIPAACVAQYPTWKLNREAADVLDQVRPEVLLVPFALDLHKDHREIFNAFAVAWRPNSPAGRAVREIYAYETLSETHWSVPYVEQGFLPNVHIDISATLETKLRALACYKSQICPAPATRSLEAARAQAVWRGAQIGVAAAEAFVLIRRII